MNRNTLRWMTLGACLTLAPAASWGQLTKPAPAPSRVIAVEQPDSERIRQELSNLLQRYPPSLRQVLATDPTLLGNESYLGTYPALMSFLAAHPEVERNPSFYVGEGPPKPRSHEDEIFGMWRDILGGFGVFLGFAMGISLLVWLVRTLIDYRRWSRLSKVQTEVHAKILERFSSNEELRSYMESPAGSGFLQSSPIRLDEGRLGPGAPLGRILWSLQGGIVLFAGGGGLQALSMRLGDDAGKPIWAIGILALALGCGFIISAGISYLICRRLGLIEHKAKE
ncbi:MAG: hypothetical protein ABI693_14140 [Bryobacteraceae bacterium]